MMLILEEPEGQRQFLNLRTARNSPVLTERLQIASRQREECLP